VVDRNKEREDGNKWNEKQFQPNPENQVTAKLLIGVNAHVVQYHFELESSARRRT
jgi:hypothetical protein